MGQDARGEAARPPPATHPPPPSGGGPAPRRRPQPDDPPELAEIRLAVLDEIRKKSYRAGAKKVFPFDLVRVSMRGVEEGRAAVFGGKFFRTCLEQEIRNSLRADGVRFPEQLPVEMQ